MKHFLLICSILLACTFTGCSTDGEWDETSLPGTWQLDAVYSSAGGPGSWSSAQNPYTIKFQRDGKFYSTRFEDCEQGIYTVTANELTLNYTCEGFSPGIGDPEGFLVENLTFIGKFMHLKPKYLFCVEGCEFKFRKIASAD